jgi:GGDEF domain-containing protein
MSVTSSARDPAPPRRILSVRVRLMIVAVIVVLPLLAERIYSEQTDRNDRIDAAYQQALGLARQGAATQDKVIVSLRAILQSVATARATFNFSDPACNEFLAKVAEPIPWIQAISVANPQGQIVCSGFPNAIGLDISQRQHFKTAVAARDFVLSDYFVGTRSKSPIITAALPQIGADDAVTAVILGVIDIRWFGQIANDFVAPSGSMLIIDGSGNVLARYPDDKLYIGRNFSDRPLIQKMLQSSSGLVTETELDGVQRIIGFVQLPDTEARFAVGFDERDVVARANHEMWTGVAELGALILLALLGIWFGGERLLVGPIRKLAQTASQIGHGELKSRTAELPWAAEFVPLAVALDEMTDKLQDREQELRDLNSQLHELAHTDALTGLANRRTFNAQLAIEWEGAASRRQPLAMLMIDVDFFKLFNDRYGHVQGDTCLRKVANILQTEVRIKGGPEDRLGPDAASSRKRDFVSRYGGEEFAVLLADADLEAAMIVGNRIRQAVEDMLMAHVGAPWGFVSISVGAAATMPSATSNPRTFVESADAALYQAKQSGRNRVVAHSMVRLSKAS